MGHSWESALRNLKLGYLCPECRLLAQESKLKVRKVSANIEIFTSNRSKAQNGKPLIWYRCDLGHEWNSNKTTNNPKPKNCVFCCNRRLLKGFNDLKTCYPKLASEWHPTKNNNLKPQDVLIGSHKHFWWICPRGHEWNAVLWRRQMGSGCKQCTLIKSPKNLENFSRSFPSLISSWHPTKNRNLLPSDFASNSTKLVWWKCSKSHEWQSSIKSRTSKQMCPKCELNLKNERNRLKLVKPSLRKEWHPTKNKKSNFNELLADSKLKYWWKCPRGHEFQESPKKRVAQSGCMLCSNRIIIAGQNDLKTTHPKIAQMWNQKRNTPLKSNQAFATSRKKVWWICPSSHEFRTEISTRVNSLNPCPYCSNHKLLSGFNDLQTLNPHLAKEWHPTKNGKVKASDVSPRIKKNAWWKCSREHEWNARIQSRNDGMGCPFCSNSRVWKGSNDLETTHPKLASEWSAKRNSIKPFEVMSGTTRKVWWECQFGHYWSASIYDRANGKGGCPTCSNRKVLTGFNDLLTLNPELATYFSEELNVGLKASNLGALGTKKIWWKCNVGHNFERTISGMKKNLKCPTCLGKVRLVGFNDLATTHPLIACEWHPTKNGKLKPQDIQIGSAKKVWWLCLEGHSWIALPHSRQRSGCPKCATFGFDQTKPSKIYFIMNKQLHARKIGIENQTSRRTELWEMAGWEIQYEILVTNGLIARAIERELLGWIRNDLGMLQYLKKEQLGKLSGATETFSISGPRNSTIIRKMEIIREEVLLKASTKNRAR